MNETFLQVRKLIQGLPDGLQGHLHRTHDKALELAALHGVDSKKVELAALGHDLFKAVDDQQLLTEARDARLAIHTIEEHVPILLHWPLAVRKLEQECGITDHDILEAVRWHSTSCAGIGNVGLVVCLADKLEVRKSTGNPRQTHTAKVAEKSLELATYEYLAMEMSSLLANDQLIHPASVQSRNDLALRFGTQLLHHHT